MSLKSIIASMLAGAGLMYFFDPRTGKRRRAMVQDKWQRLRNETTDFAEGFTEHASNRARGVASEAARHIAPEDVSDRTLAERVRSEMGRYVSHPHAVDVTVEDGVVTLTGNILAAEVQPFISKLKSMPNVEQVDNQLDVHEDAGNIPDLQGGRTRPEFRR